MLYDLLQLLAPWLESKLPYKVLQVLYQLEFRAFAAAVLSFGLVMLLGRRTIRWLLSQKVQDHPEFHNEDLNALMADRKIVPTMGGILICGTMLISVSLLASIREPYVQLAIATVVTLSVLGGVDDWLKLTAARRNPGSRKGLFAWEKLLFQLGIAFVIGLFLLRKGDPEAARILTLPFQRTYVPGELVLEAGVIILPTIIFLISTTLFISATSNAVNLTDGMDGLAPGTLLIASIGMMLLAYIAGSTDLASTLNFPRVEGAKELMVVMGAMAGACLGFLWFNCHPAQVIMGDTGSLPLGGLLAFVAVAIRQELLLVIIGGVFFMEMASVIMQVGYFKWTRGERIFRMSPIHHHFHLGGWSETQVVTRFWVLGVAFVMVALVSLKLR
ncbi:MAG: phospho-N-acetylmuramoyl-pentapeptide-transferase [Phycisphaerales bacterium]